MGTDLLDRLSALPPAQFNRLVFELGVAPGVLLPESVPQLDRAIDLVRYFQQPGLASSSILAALTRFDSLQSPRRFVELYRQRLAAKFARWGPGTLAATSSPQRFEAPFDQMYQPLRLRRRVTGDAPRGTGTNIELVLDEATLLTEPGHIAIAGAPGSGKTTWMRATFRALLGRDDALPFFVTLRDLARLWTRAPREDRSFDVFLKTLMAELVPDAEPGGLVATFAEQAGPRPVLLVDGWDELGPLGSDVHEKLLGFLARYPRVLAVVTSRPFGVNIPSPVDGFAAFEIQPLSDAEINAIVQCFFHFSYPDSKEKQVQHVTLFRRSLRNSQPASQLACLPLLLIMMLVVSRLRRLPEKRHLLYQACVESLLAAIPDEKEEEGALLPHPQYRPEDAEERISLTAALAARAVSLVYSFAEMEAFLPAGWPAVVPPRQTRRGMRMGFLQWLAGTAGLLTIHSDDTVAFAHRSLQEFLAAWHWNAKFQDASVLVQEFLDRMSDRQSWETLRLWAALAAEQSPERLTPTLNALLAPDENGNLLGGLLLADGLGPESAVPQWLVWFVDSVAERWDDDWLVCLDAWRAGPQRSRFSGLADAFFTRSVIASFSEWLRLSFACMRLGIKMMAPHGDSLAGAAVHWLHGTLDNPRGVAVGRVFCGTFPVWPNDPPELGLLQLWPNLRRLFGTRLQLAILCGAGREDIQRLARARWPGVSQSPPLDLDRARSSIEKNCLDWALNIEDLQVAYFAETWVTEAFRSLSAELQIAGIAEYLEGHVMQQGRDWIRQFCAFGYIVPTKDGKMALLQRHQAPPRIPQKNDREWALSWMQGLVRRRQPDRQEALARLWGEQVPASWMRDFVDLDLGSINRYGAVATVAVREQEAQPVRLLARACRLALTPADDAPVSTAGLLEDPADCNAETAFAEALEEFAGPPMWPALARHLCNRSTTDDQNLLIALAKNPQGTQPLAWGLQYVVRGDLLFSDGTELTLDELADDLGLPRLPMLETPALSAGALEKHIAMLMKLMVVERRKLPKQTYGFTDEYMFPINLDQIASTLETSEEGAD